MFILYSVMIQNLHTYKSYNDQIRVIAFVSPFTFSISFKLFSWFWISYKIGCLELWSPDCAVMSVFLLYNVIF
jgi:hypothetical protein